MAKKKRIPHKFLPWIDVRKTFKLSNAHVQMARELGLSPKRFPNYADRKDQPWKLPLVEFIEQLYEKQFGKTRPDEVLSIEEMAEAHLAKRAARKQQQKQEAEGIAEGEPVAEAESEQSADAEQIAEPEPVVEPEQIVEPEPVADAESSQDAEPQDAKQPQDVEGSA